MPNVSCDPTGASCSDAGCVAVAGRSTLGQRSWMVVAPGVRTPAFNPSPSQAAGNHARPARCEITIANWFASCLAARGTDLTLIFDIHEHREKLMSSREIVLCQPVRTAIGGFNGALKSVSATDLGATVVRETLKRTKLDAAQVGSVVMGNVIQAGNKMNPARQIGRASCRE